jgi:hypothetical protein
VVINVGSKPTTKTITGPINVLVSSTGITYSVTPQAGSSYSWIVSGATLGTGQGTNSITVNFGSTAGAVDIFLTEFNNYGDYTTSLHVNTGLAPTQKIISGPDYALINTSGINYSIPSIGGSSYAWTVTGATPASGTSNNIDLTFGGTAGPVTLSVTETNVFGSMTATKTVNVGIVPATPVIIGPDSIVTGTTVTYTVAPHTGSTYSWTVPAAATVSGKNTNTITISFPTGSYTLTLIETNAAGSAVGQKFNIKVGTVATVASISGTTTVIAGIQYTYTANTNAGGSSNFYWSFPAGTQIVSGLGTSTIIVIYPVGIGNTTISVTQDNGFGTSTANLSISMAPNGLWNTSNNSIAYTMFPNPFIDGVNVTFNTLVNSNLSLSIINMNGEIVFSSNEYSTNETIVLGKELPAGLYIIKAISDEKAQVIKNNKE